MNYVLIEQAVLIEYFYVLLEQAAIIEYFLKSMLCVEIEHAVLIERTDGRTDWQTDGH